MTRTGQVAGQPSANAKAVEDIEAEVSSSFRAMIDAIVHDARTGQVKVTEGKDPRKRDWVDAKNAGRKDPGGGDASLQKSAAKEPKEQAQEARADHSIETATGDLKKLDLLGSGNAGLSRTNDELAKLV